MENLYVDTIILGLVFTTCEFIKEHQFNAPKQDIET